MHSSAHKQNVSRASTDIAGKNGVSLPAPAVIQRDEDEELVRSMEDTSTKPTPGESSKALEGKAPWWKVLLNFKEGEEAHSLYFLDDELVINPYPRILGDYIHDLEKSAKELPDEAGEKGFILEIIVAIKALIGEIKEETKDQLGLDGKLVPPNMTKKLVHSVQDRLQTISEQLNAIATTGFKMQRELFMEKQPAEPVFRPPSVIKYTPVNKGYGPQGLAMKARPLSINPGDNRGSPPEDNSLGVWEHLRQTHTSIFVRGHLLNKHLYGPGEAQNLVPLENNFNKDVMSTQVEEPVKKMVLEENRVVEYDVEALYGMHPNATMLIRNNGYTVEELAAIPPQLAFTVTELAYDEKKNTWVNGRVRINRRILDNSIPAKERGFLKKSEKKAVAKSARYGALDFAPVAKPSTGAMGADVYKESVTRLHAAALKTLKSELASMVEAVSAGPEINNAGWCEQRQINIVMDAIKEYHDEMSGLKFSIADWTPEHEQIEYEYDSKFARIAGQLKAEYSVELHHRRTASPLAVTSGKDDVDMHSAKKHKGMGPAASSTLHPPVAPLIPTPMVFSNTTTTTTTTTALPAPVMPPPVAQAPPTFPAVFLVVNDDTAQTVIAELEDGMQRIYGRADALKGYSNSRIVSSKHLQIDCIGGQLYVTCVGMNSTQMDGVALEKNQPILLPAGTHIFTLSTHEVFLTLDV